MSDRQHRHAASALSGLRIAHRPRPRRLAAAMLALTLCAGLHAADWHVDAAAGGGGDGSAGRPFERVQSAVDRAGPGDAILVRPGTYREQVTVRGGGRPGAPLVIRGNGGVPTLKGSDVVTGWERAWGTTWRRRGWQRAPQVVFADGRSLRQVGPALPSYVGTAADGMPMIDAFGTDAGDLVPGSYHHDHHGHVLYARLHDDGDPHGRVIEAGARQFVIDLLDAHDVHLVGLAVRHSATGSFQVGGGAVALGTRCRAERLDVQWADFCGIQLAGGADGAEVVACVVNNNGATGIGITGHAGFRIEGCDVSWNNTRWFNPFWHAGGLKATAGAWGDIVACRFTGNAGCGAWLDWCDSGRTVRIERNRFEASRGDAGAGLMIEGSRAVRVSANLVDGNVGRGIYVAASEDVLIAHNTVTRTGTYAAIEVSGMPRAGRRLADVRLSGNLLTDNRGSNDLLLLRENGGDIARIQVDHTLVHRAGGARIWWGRDGRHGWDGAQYASVAAWRAAAGGGVGCIERDPRLDGGSTPAADSPARGAAVRLDGVEADHQGAPMGDPPTIGAIQGSGGVAGWRASGDDAGSGRVAPATTAGGSSGGCGLGSGVALALSAIALLSARARRR